MSCYKPMLAVAKSINHSTGKVQYKFIGHLMDSVELSEVDLVEGEYYPRKALPCGKCIGCRLDYAREWAIRCMLELQDHDPQDCYFITFTYDDDHVRWSLPEVVEVFHGAPVDLDAPFSPFYFDSYQRQSNMTLDFFDWRQFYDVLKRSQAYHYGSTFRFYMCGEYGTDTMRPHFHVIFYGLKLPPMEESDWHKTTGQGYIIWESKYLEKLWKKGNVIVGRVSYNSCEYVARYMLKKQKGSDSEFYETFNIVPPACRMSMRPGIGMKYYKEHAMDIYKYDEIYLSTENGGKTIKPPKRFDKAFEEEFPGYYLGVKGDRELLAFENMVSKEIENKAPIGLVLAREEVARKKNSKILNKRSVGNG